MREKNRRHIIHYYCRQPLLRCRSILTKKSHFATFHIKQAFGIHLLFHVIMYFMSKGDAFNITLILWCLYLGLIIFLAVQAKSGQKFEIPFFGPLFQKWFKFIG